MSDLGRNVSPLEGRFLLLVVGLCAVFAVFLLRLFQLQIIQGEDLRARSERNFVRTVRLEAARGEILDREGRVLATTRPAFDVTVIPSEVRDADRTFAALAQLLDQERAVLRERVGTPRGRARFQPVVVAGDLPWERLTRVETHRYALAGVLTDVRPLRTYPQGPLFGHVLGSIGEVTRRQLDSRSFAGYRPGDVVGQSGLEAALERELRGRDGGRNVVVDVAGREVDVIDEVRPERGRTAVLTLDLDLQRAAVEGFQEVAGEGATPTGALVALDPRSGEVLALVSVPAPDPNQFAGGIDPKGWQELTHDPLLPLQNRALDGQYPPGSTYKAVVAAAALQEGILTPRTSFYCPGSFTLGNRRYRCWRDQGHGEMDLRHALEQSCDVYFYNAGLKLGVDRLAYFARGFGLGRATGLAGGSEAEGLVPTRAWKQRRFGEPWVRGETVSASIGQGQNLVTPLQLAVAYAAIANGGEVVVPRLLLHLETLDGAVMHAPTAVVQGRAPVDMEHLTQVSRGLLAAVQGERATGRRARVEGLTVAGKTGTAQVVRLGERREEVDEMPRAHRDHAWFAAYAPADAPEIVVVALNEHAGHGGSAAAPVAQRVLQRWFDKRTAPALPVETARGATPEAGG